MAKQGLKKIWILKGQIGLIWGEPDGEGEEEEKEEEEKKRSQDQANKVWNFGFCMDHMEL